jgi:hypothetical protein
MSAAFMREKKRPFSNEEGAEPGFSEYYIKSEMYWKYFCPVQTRPAN